MPELSNDSLSWAAKDMEKRIRAKAPSNVRQSIVVRPFRKGEKTGIYIEYDDSAEQLVYVAIEYPKGSGLHEDVAPTTEARSQ